MNAEWAPMTPRHHLVVFVRAPRIGRVKTRLAGDIGAVGAGVALIVSGD